MCVSVCVSVCVCVCVCMAQRGSCSWQHLSLLFSREYNFSSQERVCVKCKTPSVFSPCVCVRVCVCVSEIVDYIERLQVLREIVKKFPPVNYQVFKYIITHLNR